MNYRCHPSKHSFCFPDENQKGQKTLRDCLIECVAYKEQSRDVHKLDAPEYRIRRAYEDLVGDILHPSCLKDRDNLLRMLQNVRIAQAILRWEIEGNRRDLQTLENLTTELLSQCDVAFLIWYLTKPYHHHASDHLQDRVRVLTHKERAVQYRAFVINMLSRTSGCYSKRCSQRIKASVLERARENVRIIQHSEFGSYLLDVFDRILS